MFLPRDASASARDRPALRAIEDDEVGRRALDEPDRAVAPRPGAEHGRRTRRQRLDGAGERQPAGVDGGEQDAERGLDAR